MAVSWVRAQKIGSADSVANLSAIGFSPNAMRTFIGFSVEDALIESVFQSLNFSIERSDDSSDAFWKVSVPSYRQDLTRAVDLYEEFIRIYGTDKIPLLNRYEQKVSMNWIIQYTLTILQWALI